MSDAYTTRKRITLIEPGTRPNTWGVTLNAAIQLIDDALGGWVTLATSTVLSSTNGTTDQARKVMLRATAAITITIPEVEGWYWVNASNGDVVVTNSANSVTVKSGNTAVVLTDGTNVYQGVFSDFGAVVPKTTTNPTSDDHLTRKGWVAAQIAAASIGVISPGAAGTFITSDGTTATWATITTADIDGLDTALDSYYTKTASDARYYTQSVLDAALALKAPLASPTFTGTPAAPTAAAGTSTTQVATTAFVQAASLIKAHCAFEGTTGVRINQSNVASVTRNATGRYTVVFTTNLPNSEYSVTLGMETGTLDLDIRVKSGTRANSGFQIECVTGAGTYVDPDYAFFSVQRA